MDGREITFTQRDMPFKAMRATYAEIGDTVHIGDCKCRVRVVRRKEAEKGKRYEIRFPDTELEKKMPMGKTTLVGYMEIKGNWKKHEGKCIFHPIGKNG